MYRGYPVTAGALIVPVANKVSCAALNANARFVMTPVDCCEKLIVARTTVPPPTNWPASRMNVPMPGPAKVTVYTPVLRLANVYEPSLVVTLLLLPGDAVTVTPESLASGPPYSSCSDTKPVHEPVRAGPAGPCGPVSPLQPATANATSIPHSAFSTWVLLKGVFALQTVRRSRVLTRTK